MIKQWPKLDIWIALSVILAGLVLLAIAAVVAPDQYGLAIAVLATSGGYLVMRESLGVSQRDQSIVGSGVPLQAWVVRVVTGCILVLLTLVVGVSYNSLGRPSWIIFALSIIPLCILFQVLLMPKLSKEIETLLLLQVTFLLAAIVLSSVYAFPYNGGDTTNHIHIASAIASSGTIEETPKSYRNYPLYPAVATALSDLIGFDLQHAFRLSNLAGALIGLLALYGLSRIYYSASQSLILALLLVGSRWFVYWTTLVVSMITAIWLFCLFVSIVLKRFSTPLSPWAILTIIIFAVGAPFFHPIGAAAVVMLLGGFSVLDMIRSGRKGPQWRISLVGLAILTTIVTLTQWMYYGTTFESSLRALANTISGIDQPQLVSAYRDATVYNLDQINLYVLYSLSGLGLLNALRVRRSAIDIYAGVVGFGFVVFGYLVQVLVIEALVGHRWLLFASLLLVFPASSMLYSLACRRSTVTRALLLAGTAVYFLLGLGSTETNRDRPLYGKDFTVLYEVTRSEHAGLLYLEGFADEYLSADMSLCYHLKWYFPPDRLNCWREADFARVHGVFTFRDVYLNRRMLVGRELTSDDLAFMSEEGVVLMYDSGDLKVFERSHALLSSSE